MLEYLLEPFTGARCALEIGCGTGHFAAFLAARGFVVTGLDRAPRMLQEARRHSPSVRLALGEACHLPFRSKSVDMAAFVTTLEFLDDPTRALREAARVARKGIVAIALNRYSLGGLSRRWGPQSRGALLPQAHDFSMTQFRRLLQDATGASSEHVRVASTLFPSALSSNISGLCLGDVLGGAVELNDATIRDVAASQRLVT
jgi:ubiquinone/menaquinone biosynthesis C-methylase UbiE